VRRIEVPLLVRGNHCKLRGKGKDRISHFEVRWVYINNGMKPAKSLGQHAMAFEVALGATDVYSAYEEGKDWHKELAEVTAEIGGGVVGADLAEATLTLLMNPFTGSALIVIAFGVAISVFFSQIANWLVKMEWPNK